MRGPARQVIALPLLLVFVAMAAAEVCPKSQVPKAERDAADQLFFLSETEQAEAIQTLLRHALDGGPVEAGGPGPPLDAGHRPQPDAQALGHLSVGPAQGPLLAEDLADLTHG